MTLIGRRRETVGAKRQGTPPSVTRTRSGLKNGWCLLFPHPRSFSRREKEVKIFSPSGKYPLPPEEGRVTANFEMASSQRSICKHAARAISVNYRAIETSHT